MANEARFSSSQSREKRKKESERKNLSENERKAELCWWKKLSRLELVEMCMEMVMKGGSTNVSRFFRETYSRQSFVRGRMSVEELSKHLIRIVDEMMMAIRYIVKCELFHD